MRMKNNMEKIHPKTTIGHVHLKVSDIDKALKFYEDVLGFEVSSRMGDNAVFLSAGGYHHHIGLNTWESKGAKAPHGKTTGLYHFAILMPDRKELAKIFKRILESNYPIDGMADHSVSEAIYLRDPDGNGVEIYADRDRKSWKHNPDGSIVMVTEELDVDDLMKELK